MKRLTSHFLLLLMLMLSGGAVADQHSPFRVWVPVVYPGTITHNKMKPFLDRLAQSLGRPVKLLVYPDMTTLLQRCASGDVDSALLASRQAQQVMQHCDFRLLAVARQPYLLYTTRTDSPRQLSEIRTIATHGPSSGGHILSDELDHAGERYQLVDYDNILDAIHDLLNNTVDAFISIAGPIDNLNPRLHQQLQVLYRFQTESEAFAIVSPQLSDRDVGLMRDLLTGDDPAVQAVFQGQFGLGKYSVPIVQNGDEAATETGGQP